MMTLAELGAFALLAYWLYVTFACQKPDQVLQTKLQLLLVATLASGALLHAWRRWSPGRKERDVSGQAPYSSLSHLPLWLAWLGLSVVAWAIFGQKMIWELEGRLAFLSTPAGATDPVSATVDGRLYVAALALIISVVTGVYLAILHRATDRADKVVDRLQGYETKLKELAKEQHNSADDVSAMEMRLRSDVLMPMLTHLASLCETQKVVTPSRGQEDIRKLQNRVQAEMRLYGLSKSKSGRDFLIVWEDLRAFERIFQEESQAFEHLFRMAERRLSTLFEQGKADRNNEKLRAAADELQEYARQNKLAQ